METAPDEWFRNCGTRLAYTYGAPARTIASCCSIGLTISKFATQLFHLPLSRGNRTWPGSRENCTRAGVSFGSQRMPKALLWGRFVLIYERTQRSRSTLASREPDAARGSLTR